MKTTIVETGEDTRAGPRRSPSVIDVQAVGAGHTYRTSKAAPSRTTRAPTSAGSSKPTSPGR